MRHITSKRGRILEIFTIHFIHDVVRTPQLPNTLPFALQSRFSCPSKRDSKISVLPRETALGRLVRARKSGKIRRLTSAERIDAYPDVVPETERVKPGNSRAGKEGRRRKDQPRPCRGYVRHSRPRIFRSRSALSLSCADITSASVSGRKA